MSLSPLGEQALAPDPVPAPVLVWCRATLKPRQHAAHYNHHDDRNRVEKAPDMPAEQFRDLAAPLYADPERRARVEAETQAAIAAQRLAQVRETRGLTQTQLAEQLGITQVHVSRIECADETDLTTLCRYVETLGGHVELRAVFDDTSVPLALPRIQQR